MLARICCGVAFAALSVGAASADELPAVLIATDKSKVTLVFDHVLPSVPGKSMKGVLVEYQPGGSSPAHTNPKSAFIYATVLEGEIRSKFNEGTENVYCTGKNLSALIGDHLGDSANN